MIAAIVTIIDSLGGAFIAVGILLCAVAWLEGARR
jgi:hypothetical protein